MEIQWNINEQKVSNERNSKIENEVNLFEKRNICSKKIDIFEKRMKKIFFVFDSFEILCVEKHDHLSIDFHSTLPSIHSIEIHQIFDRW